MKSKLFQAVLFVLLGTPSVHATDDPILKIYEARVKSAQAYRCQAALIVGGGAAVGAALAAVTRVPFPSVIYGWEFPFASREPAPQPLLPIVGAGALIGTLISASILESVGPPQKDTRRYIGAVKFALENDTSGTDSFDAFLYAVQSRLTNPPGNGQVANLLVEFHRGLAAENLPKRPFKAAVVYVADRLR